jgi:hypothetical protein
MAVVETYWSGVLQRLQAEVDVFNRLIHHSGEKGRENELSLARILAGLIPQRYGVGSGLLIDSQDSYSRQTDIVIFNQADDPALLAQSTQVLFPIESVRACVEVKTTIDTEELKDTGRKTAQIRSMSPRTGQYPTCALLGYDSKIEPKTIADQLGKLDQHMRPDIVCILKVGLIAGTLAGLGLGSDCGAPESFVIGLTELHRLDQSGARIVGHFEQQREDFIEPTFERDGVLYPIVSSNRSHFIVEPSRALLLFCESLIRGLTVYENRVVPTLSYYITSTARELRFIQ